MGFYGEQVLPRITNVACARRSTDPLRQRVCEQLAGRVVEMGFGSGLNIPFYPGHGDRGSLPSSPPTSDGSWQNEIAASRVPMRREGLDGQKLPFPDESFDAALSTWTLCTIPDVAAALRELRRVLKPGGTLHFVEHGLAPDERVQRWQHRFEPLQKRVAGGCHLTRPIVDLLIAAGFTITDVEVFYERGAPKFLAANSLGIATSK